jgi:hypothetical protein
MKITVTQEDLACGTPGDPASCPVARAVRRATGEEDVRVFMRGVTIWQLDETTVAGRRIKKAYKNSERLTDFIMKVDSCRAVKPASFLLRESELI